MVMVEYLHTSSCGDCPLIAELNLERSMNDRAIADVSSPENISRNNDIAYSLCSANSSLSFEQVMVDTDIRSAKLNDELIKLIRSYIRESNSCTVRIRQLITNCDGPEMKDKKFICKSRKK